MSINDINLDNNEWKIFTLSQELNETKKALAEKEAQIKALKEADYWFARSYKNHINKL
jgi:hypothetical protein